jgi:hypothetical protein
MGVDLRATLHMRAEAEDCTVEITLRSGKVQAWEVLRYPLNRVAVYWGRGLCMTTTVTRWPPTTPRTV